MQDSGELHEHRDRRAAWADVTGGGRFVKHKNNFPKLRNRKAVGQKQRWLFGEETPFPHTASDLSLCIFLLCTGRPSQRWFFSVLSVSVAHPGISLPAGRWAGGKQGHFHFVFGFFFCCFFFLFCTLPLQPPMYLLCNTVLTSLSGLPPVRWRSRRGLRLGELEREQRGGVRDELRQWNRSHFTFCHETKCLQITNRITSLGVNQHRTHPVHVSSDGLFSTCFSRPTSAGGKACSEGGWELCYAWL